MPANIDGTARIRSLRFWESDGWASALNRIRQASFPTDTRDLLWLALRLGRALPVGATGAGRTD